MKRFAAALLLLTVGCAKSPAPPASSPFRRAVTADSPAEATTGCASPQIAIGTGPGALTRFRLERLSHTGGELSLAEAMPGYLFGSTAPLGMRVALGDVRGDGNADLVLAHGPQTIPGRRGYGRRLAVLYPDEPRSDDRGYYPNLQVPFDEGNEFRGSFVAAVNLDPRTPGRNAKEVIAGEDFGGRAPDRLAGFEGARVSVFRHRVHRYDGFGYPVYTERLAPAGSFVPYGGYVGGVSVAGGDLDNDGVAEVITAPASHGGPHVRIFRVRRVGEEYRFLPAFEFMAYRGDFTGGVMVASRDVTGDGHPDVITGAGPGGRSQVKVFDGRLLMQGRLQVVRDFSAYGNFDGGVNVAAFDLNGDGFADIVTGPRAGSSDVRVYDGATGRVIYRTSLKLATPGGVYVAAGCGDR